MSLPNDLRAVPLAELLPALGYESCRRYAGPCPCCGAEQRSRSDRRPPLVIRNPLGLWHCKACGAGGDALDLVALVVVGARLPGLDRPRLEQLRAWAADRGWTPQRGTPQPGARWPAPAPRRRPQAAPERPEEQRHPAKVVRAVWGPCCPASDAPELRPWFDSRELDPEAIADRDLARVLRLDATLPRWAFFNRQPWSLTGHRLVLPVYDCRAALVGLRARYVGPGRAQAKEVSPHGRGAVANAVYADPTARQILELGRAPDWLLPRTPPKARPLTPAAARERPDRTACMKAG